MFVQDLVEIEQTNLTTTKKKYCTAGTEYRLLSSSSWLDSLRIDHKGSLTSAPTISSKVIREMRRMMLTGTRHVISS